MALDTLQMTDRLTQAGMNRQQAEAVVRAMVDAQRELVTREQLEIALAPIRTDLAVLKWMNAAIGSAVLAQLLRSLLGG